MPWPADHPTQWHPTQSVQRSHSGNESRTAKRPSPWPPRPGRVTGQEHPSPPLPGQHHDHPPNLTSSLADQRGRKKENNPGGIGGGTAGPAPHRYQGGWTWGNSYPPSSRHRRTPNWPRPMPTMQKKNYHVLLCYALRISVRISLSELPAVCPKCFTNRSPMCCANHGCIA